ncbi:RNA polymerase subunit sigma-24 [Rhodococcus sp. LW-XY12]|uniref:RNA polymerase subunit sigma-24 n=1 Tax=Rhodococcus sp. LW-XY12 TaxID=2856851 RepID=UPI001C5750E7|nr:RNA polymerase subunit sigma-24 [Rhodococcus sp. LW-XY12]QXU53695.1 RNA polymerase subunit sigma-24 [Rhodococcus sp. LW-XY12]
MANGGRGFGAGTDVTASQFTTCELAWTVASGDATAIPRLLRDLHPLVIAYFRARAKAAGGTFADADRLALAACRAILAGLTAPSGADRPFLRLAYTLVADAADAEFASPRAFPLTRLQQEILILRTIVGLDSWQTAVALAVAPGRVGVEQHAALSSLRAA